MRFSSKVVLLLLLVSVVPLGTAGLVFATLTRGALGQQVHGLQQAMAQTMAAHVDDWWNRVTADLVRAAAYLPLDEATATEMGALLQVPFRQLDYLTAVFALNSDGGRVGAAAYVSTELVEVPPDLRDRPRLSPDDERRLGERLPKQPTGGDRGLLCSAPYRALRGDIRMACRVGRGAGARPIVLCVELSLAPLARIVTTRDADAGTAALVDHAGRVLQSSGRPGQGTLELGAIAQAQRLGAEYKTPDRRSVIGARAPIAHHGWSIIVEQDATVALGGAREVLWLGVLWTGACLVFALLGGLYLSRGVTRPVEVLAVAASKVELGEYDVRLPVTGADELAQLTETFNHMVSAIQQAMALLEQQKGELATWNTELQARVEARTREVRDALDQVIRSQKLGALGELGAGIAHEINNPLTGLMGFAELLKSELPEASEGREFVAQIIQQARRIREVVSTFQRFCEQPEGVPAAAVNLGEVCRGAVTLLQSSLDQAQVKTDVRIDGALPRVRGDADALQQVLLHLLRNAISAMQHGDTLSLTVSELAEAVQITVADTGKGIAALDLPRIFEPFFARDKTSTHRTGMGLAVSARIIEQHQGKITVRSSPGDTVFTVFLPGIRSDRHLA